MKTKIKRVTSVFLCIAVFIGVFSVTKPVKAATYSTWAAAAAAAIDRGPGGIGDYVDSGAGNSVLVFTAKGLAWVADAINKSPDGYADRTVILQADIDLSDFVEEDWIPMGTSANPFKGTFSGGYSSPYFSISGITNASKTTDGLGLFGYVDASATIKDLTILNSAMQVNVAEVGAIAGVNDGTIENCTVAESPGPNVSVWGTYNVGAVAGVNNGTIKNCTVEEPANVSANTSGVSPEMAIAGGIAGSNFGTITDCVFKGIVGVMGAQKMVGGIAGSNISGTIQNSSASGTVSTDPGATSPAVTSDAGGIVGLNISDASVRNCYSTVAVTGSGDIGGIAGSNVGDASVENCYSTFTYTLPASGEGTPSLGGIIGTNNSKGSVLNNYYGKTTGNEYKPIHSNHSLSVDTISRPIAEMQGASSDTLNKLNEWVVDNKQVYSSLYYWQGAASQTPTFVDSASFTVTFNLNGGEDSLGGTGPVVGFSDARGNVDFPGDPVKDDYAFVGWFDRTSGGNQLHRYEYFGTNTVVYAQWEYTGLKIQDLKFPSSFEIKSLADEPFTIQATEAKITPIAYTSSNPAVATVDNTGKVTLKGIGGTTTITATAPQGIAADGVNYARGTESYSLIVKQVIQLNDNSDLHLRASLDEDFLTVMGRSISFNDVELEKTQNMDGSIDLRLEGRQVAKLRNGSVIVEFDSAFINSYDPGRYSLEFGATVNAPEFSLLVYIQEPNSVINATSVTSPSRPTSRPDPEETPTASPDPSQSPVPSVSPGPSGTVGPVSPETGDDQAFLIMYVIIAIVASLGIVSLLIYKKVRAR